MGMNRRESSTGDGRPTELGRKWEKTEYQAKEMAEEKSQQEVHCECTR
jgi:hypothetical protein